MTLAMSLPTACKPGIGWPALLNGGGLNVQTRKPEQCEWTLDALSNYSGVLIENVSASKITERGMWKAEVTRR